MGVQNPNSTSYVHPNEPNILNIHKAMEYNSNGEPAIRTSGAAGQGTDILARIEIANNEVSGYSYINKFGYRELPQSPTAFYPLYSRYDSGDTTKYYDYPTSATTASVSSSDSNDNGGTVTVSGLDVNYAEVSETITIGQTGTTNFFRVHRVSMVTVGSGTDTNIGNITVVVNAKDVAYIPAGYGQTLQTIYTVPASKTAYVFQIDVGSDTKDKPVHVRLRTRDNTVTNVAWQTKAFIVMENNYVSHTQSVPIVIPEKNDIQLEGNNSSVGGLEVSGGFDLVLKDNPT